MEGFIGFYRQKYEIVRSISRCIYLSFIVAAIFHSLCLKMDEVVIKPLYFLYLHC